MSEGFVGTLFDDSKSHPLIGQDAKCNGIDVIIVFKDLKLMQKYTLR